VPAALFPERAEITVVLVTNPRPSWPDAAARVDGSGQPLENARVSSRWSRAERLTFAGGLVLTVGAVLATRVAHTITAVRFWDNVHWTVSYAAAAALAYLSARRATGPTRRARTWFAAGLGALFSGQVLWDIQVAVGWNPFPGPSDGLFVLLGPLFVVGVISLTRDQSAARRVAIALDGAGIGLSLLALTLAAYLPRQGDFSGFTMAVLVAYPAALLAVTALLFLVVLELKEPPRPALFLLVAGTLGQGLLWMKWNRDTLANELGDGLLLNYLFSFGALFLGVGVSKFVLSGSEVGGRLRRAYELVSLMIPLILVVAAAVALAMSSGLLPRPRSAVRVCMVLVVIVAAVRQVLLLEEGERMLAAEARTRALEEKMARSQRLESLGTLAGGIAHDFNNLLTAMLGHVEILRTLSGLPPAAQDSIEGLRAGANRARDVVRRILAFSRHETTSIESVDAVDLVEEVVALLRAALPARHTLSIRAEGRPTLRGSPAQIHQVLMNLGTNSSHAIGARVGTITFSVGTLEVGPEDPTLPPGAYVELGVADDGCGMEPATQAKMFDPFFTTKKREEGTGLGLSVVHGIVAEHAGAIRVSSTLGEGTRVRVLVPSAGPLELPAAKQGSSGSLRRPTVLSDGDVLVVDDEPLIGSTLVRLITHLGQRATYVTSPEEGLRAVENEPDRFALVVTDMSMPTMTGSELARAVRDVKPDLRVVLSSGTDFVLSGTPFDDVLPKPYTVGALAAVLERNLPGRPAASPSTPPA
jgi:signal transduction histidine kinase/ActR/RegA family two-component response regulator